MQPLWKTVWRFCKKLKTELPYDLAILLLGKYPKTNKQTSRTLIWKDLCTPMFKSALFTTVKVWKWPKCPSTEEWMKMWGVYIYIYIFVCIHTHTQWNLLSYKKERKFSICRKKWIDLKGIMLSKVSQRKINLVWYHLYVESKTYNELVNKTKRNRLTDLEN